MNFCEEDSFFERFRKSNKSLHGKQEQYRFQVIHDRMEKKMIEKSKFAQINNKRFYFSDRVVSFPFSCPNLRDLIEYNEQNGQKRENFILDEKQNLLKLEHKAMIKMKD